MRRSASLSLFLAILSVFSGYLLSSATWIGRVGISLFHQEYEFLKSWWKAGLLVFVVLMLLYMLQSAIQKYGSKSISILVDVVALIAAFIGLYLTYDDFRKDLSHRWMGERFHIGAYLFWIGWMVVSIYLLVNKKNKQSMKKKIGMDV